MGYVWPDHEAFGALRLADSSRALLKGEATVLMRSALAQQPGKRDRRNKAAQGFEPSGGGIISNAAEAVLLARLKVWRAEQARTQGVPAFVIFHDSTLATLAVQKPDSLQALAGISGIGEKKRERYGEALLAILRA